jgi:hypothetical protein
MSDGLLGVLSDELKKLFQPLILVVDNPLLLDRLLLGIGAASETAGGDALLTAITKLVEVGQQLDQLSSQPSPSFSGIAALLEASDGAFQAIRALGNAGGPAAAIENFGRDLAGFLLSAYLSRWHPLAREIAALLTVVEPAETQDVQPAALDVNDNVIRLPFRVDRFHFDRLSHLLSDPAGTLRGAYGNDLLTVADANAIADKLFPRVLALLRILGVTCRYGFTPGDEPLFGDAAPFVDHALIVYAADQALGADVEAGVVLAFSSADRGDLGLVMTPFGSLQINTQAGAWTLTLDFTADVRGVSYGRHGVTILAGASTVEIDGSFSATLPRPSDGSAFIVGSSDGSRLEVAGAQLKAGISLSEAKQSFALSAEVSKAAIVIAPGDGDGFLKSVLPANGARAEFDLGLAWTNTSGLVVKGAGGLDVDVPTGLSLGGVVTVDSIHVGIRADDSSVTLECSVNVGLTLGPVQVVVNRAGVLALFAFPDQGGNLGLLDAALSFKPPSGLGLAIDAGGVTGGGFLNHDDAKHEYGGVLQLDFYAYKLTAFGLLATVLPTGPGYSLIAMVDGEFPPIQLVFGFALTGAGGLFGVHRTANVEALRAALTAHTISNLLFPKAPISNAPQLLTELDTLFPGADGRFIFGPVVRIVWGTPALLTLDLALILELPDPIKLILIAELTVLLPTPEEKVVEIHLSALGTLDFAAGEAGLDATLHDSRLVSFTLHGSMAMRVGWSGKKTFLLAIGGVHPKFQPPPSFPKLDRVGISMPSGNIAKLNLDGYLAITSNTYQIGAHVDIFVGVDGFGVSGYLNFDTLIHRHPFHFDGDISGAVTLSAGGEDLMSLKLSASLSGPGPWNAAGSVTFDVLWWTVTKSFHQTFGDPVSDLVLEAVDVGQLLRTALTDTQSFSALFAPGVSSLVTLTMPKVAATVVLAHPGASLSVHQTVVPLGLTISQFGGAVPQGETRFDITGVTVGSNAQPSTTPALDDFAVAQFLSLSDDEKLARPSFESFASGVMLETATTFGVPAARQVAYDTWFADTLDGPLREDTGIPAPLPGDVLAGFLLDGAAARSELAQSGSARYAGPKHLVAPAELDFVVATSDQLTVSGVGAASGLSYSQAQVALSAELALHPERRGALLVTARYEVPA